MLNFIEIPCDENAEWHVIDGMIECFCNYGYYGNGTDCTGTFDFDKSRCS
jgi:hypothetical protein